MNGRIAIFLLIGLFILLPACKNKTVLAGDLDAADTASLSRPMQLLQQYSLAFNNYRKENQLPLLPAHFRLAKRGYDFASWQNPDPHYPAYTEKLLTWHSGGSLLWENNLYRGQAGEILSFRYNRRAIDSFLLHYDTLETGYKRDVDTFFFRNYRYYDKNGTRISLDKRQFDSILHAWNLTTHTP